MTLQIQRFISGWGLVIIADLFSKVIGFLLLPFYISRMPPSEFGIFNYSLMIAGVASLVFGLGQYAVYTRAEIESNPSEIRSATVRNMLAGSIIWLFLLPILFLFFPLLIFKSSQDLLTWLFIAVYPVTLIVSQILTIDLFLIKNYKIAVIRSIAEFICTHSLSIIFILNFPDYSCNARLAATLISSLIIISTFFRFTRIQESLRLIHSDSSILKLDFKALKDGLPLSANGLISLFSSNGDRYLLEKIALKEELGYFSFASSISSVIQMGFSSFNNVWLGYFYQTNRSTNWRVKYSFYIALAWGAFGGVFFFATKLAFYYLPDKLGRYNNSQGLVAALIASIVLQICGHLITNFFNLWKANKYTSPINIIAGVVGFSAGCLLIPKYGASGAAIQSLVASIVALILLLALAVYLGKLRRQDGSY